MTLRMVDRDVLIRAEDIVNLIEQGVEYSAVGAIDCPHCDGEARVDIGNTVDYDYLQAEIYRLIDKTRGES